MGKLWKPRQKDMLPGEQSLLPGDPLTSAYVNGRREWDERVGDAVARERAWKKGFFTILGVLAISVSGNVYQGTQSKIVPYVVEREKYGDIVAVRAADVAQAPDPAHIKSALSRWIGGTREVFMDVYALKKSIKSTYALTGSNGPAIQQLNDMYRTNDFFERAKKEVVSIANVTALPVSAKDGEGRETWRLEWQENTLNRMGEQIRSEPWTATVTFVVTPPNTAEQVMLNPDGIFVISYSWSART
jgi:type IV secretion system protein VirB5